jgi:hypothetical protein
MVSATTDPDRSGTWLHNAFSCPVSSHTERRSRMYSAQSFAAAHHTIALITVITRKTVSGGALATMQTPQGRVSKFGRPTFAGQQELLDKGLQHAGSVCPPDVY